MDEPEAVSLKGTQPVHDADIDSLANERTMLAWVRTGFSLVALGGLVLHFSQERLVARELAIGIGTIATGVCVWLLGYYRFRTGERAIAAGDPTLPIGTVRGIAVAVSLAASAALAMALLSPSG